MKQVQIIPTADQKNVQKSTDISDNLHATFYTKYGKRLFDLTLAILLIPFLLPLIAIIALLVSLDSGTPFFGHVRVGRNGKHFKCWKLRTMHLNAEHGLQALIDQDEALANYWRIHQKLESDPRITFFGKLLRKTRLDELPQIFNVLLGEMSFVGPRPFSVEQKKLYDFAGGSEYYSLRPGISGNWQINQIRTPRFEDRINYDKYYSKNISLKLDLKISILTVLTIIKMNGN